MQLLFKVFLAVHIVAGTTALLSGPFAMLTKKGSKQHRLSGKIYVWSMAVVTGAAIYLAIAHNNPFLLMVAVFSIHSIISAYRFLYLKKISFLKKPFLIDWIIAIAAASFCVSLIAWGVNLWLNKNNFGLVAIVFGGIGLRNSWNGIKPFYFTPKSKLYWLYNHISGMIGGYIATTTAFLVVNVKFQPSFLLWLAPTVIGVPFIFYSINKYRKLEKENKSALQMNIEVK